MSTSEGSTVVAFVPDLMDRSRFPKAVSVTFVKDASELASFSAGAKTVVADLDRSGALEALMTVSDSKQRIGFTSHENTEVLEKAKEAGIEAMARSRFFSRITDVLAGS